MNTHFMSIQPIGRFSNATRYYIKALRNISADQRFDNAARQAQNHVRLL